MVWSRRRFVKLLSGVPASGLFPFLSYPTVEAAGQDTPGISASTSSLAASAAPTGKTQSRLGYKMICWDLQFMDENPSALKYSDAEKYADAVARAGADSHLVYAVTNTGMALYKSQYLPKFKNLPDDFVGQYLEACRKRGIKTELYYSLGAQRTLCLEHPEWTMQDVNSKPIMDEDDPSPDVFMGPNTYPCFNSPFYEYALKEVKELADRFTFDFWDVDILLWWGLGRNICYNPYCLEKWKARTGQDLPHPLPRELFPEYMEFMRDTNRSMYKAIKDQVKASGHDVPITHNGGFDYELDDFVMFEWNPGGADYYSLSTYAKSFRAHAHGREMQINPHRANKYIDYVNCPIPTLTWESAMTVSHNAGQMWCDMANIDGRIDEMAVRSMKEVFRVVDHLVPKIQGTVPYAEIAVLLSERDHLLIEGLDVKDPEDFSGACKLLSDLHWPYDVVADEHLNLAELSSYRLLIVPSLHYLAQEHRQMVLEYLQQGGHVFFCGRCALLDRDGRPHADPELGLVKVQERHERRSYIKTVFPIDDERLKAVGMATVEPDSSLTVLGKLIQMSALIQEGIPHQEPAFPLGETDLPVMVTGRKGQGQFTYVGYAFFHEYLHQGLPVIAEAFTKLVADFYRPSMWVEAPTVVEAIYNKLGNEIRVSLVNGTSTRPKTGGWVNIVEVIPIMGMKIAVRDRKVLRAVDLAGRELSIAKQGGKATVTVPRLEQYDLVSLELG